MIYNHPDIIDCSVIVVRDVKAGKAVKLFGVFKNFRLVYQALMQFCQERLTAYKVTKIIKFSDDLPKPLAGKVLRRELHEK